MIGGAKQLDLEGEAGGPDLGDADPGIDLVVDIDGAMKGDLRLFHMIGDVRPAMSEMIVDLRPDQEFDDRVLTIVEINGAVDMAKYVDVAHRDTELRVRFDCLVHA